MINKLIPTGKNRVQAIGLIVVALCIGAVAMGGASAAETELHNETVNVTNDTGSIWASATFADSVDEANATANVTVLSPDGSEFRTETINGTPGDRSDVEFRIKSLDSHGNYTVLVDGDSAVVESADAGSHQTVGGGGPVTKDDGRGSIMGFPLWAVVIAGGGLVVYGSSEGWWGDSL